MSTGQVHDQTQVLLQEKLEALRAAVKDPGLSKPPIESLRSMFVSWTNRFTVWHVRILAFLDDPRGWFQVQNREFPAFMTSSLGNILIEAFPELNGQRGFYELIAKDLWNNGMLNTEGLHAMMSASGAGASRTTDIGKQFLRFITDQRPST